MRLTATLPGDSLGNFTLARQGEGVGCGARPGPEHHGPTAAGTREFHRKGSGGSYRLFVREQIA